VSEASQATDRPSEFPFLAPDRPLDKCLPPRIADAVAAHAAMYGEPAVNVAAAAMCLMAACARCVLRPASRNRRATGMVFNLMPVLPPGRHGAPWIDHLVAACRPSLEFNDALHRRGETGVYHNMQLGLVGYPTPSPLTNCMRPSELMRDPDPGGASTRLYVNPGANPVDELRRLSPWERGELLRLLSLAWEGEPVNAGDGPRALDVAMLAPVEPASAAEMLAWLDAAVTPPPFVILRCGASPPVAGGSQESFRPTDFIDPILLGRPAPPRPVPLGADADAELERLEEQIAARLLELNRPALSRHLRFVPGLIRRLLVLLAALCPGGIVEPAKEEAECLAMAKGLVFHIAMAHIAALRTLTSGFTAATGDRTGDPAETIAELMLLAKIRELGPVTRSKLRGRLSDRQRRELNRRLAILLDRRKVEIDGRGRLRASREWGG